MTTPPAPGRHLPHVFDIERHGRTIGTVITDNLFAPPFRLDSGASMYWAGPWTKWRGVRVLDKMNKREESTK